MVRSRWAARKASSESSPQNLRERAVQLAHNSHMYSSCNPRRLVLQPRAPVAESARKYLLENPSEQPVHGNTELVRKEVAFVGDRPEACSSSMMLMLPGISIRGNNTANCSSKGSSSSRVWNSASTAPTSKCSGEVSPSASTAVSSSLRDRS